MNLYALEKETTRKSLPEQVFFLLTGLFLAYQLAVFLALSFFNDGAGVVLAAIFGFGTFFLLAGLREFNPAPARGGVLVGRRHSQYLHVLDDPPLRNRSGSRHMRPPEHWQP